MYIDTKEIFHNATQTSVERGRALYQTQIIKAFLTNEGYTIHVAGSETYVVKISTDKYGVTTKCSCPFDYHGNCKHIVAAAYAIQNRNIEERTVQDYTRGIQTLEGSNDVDFMNHTFNSVSDFEKLAFLEDLLENNQALRMQFMQFFKL